MLKQTEVLIRNSPLSERGFQSLQEEVSELVFEKPPVSVARPSLPGLPPPRPVGGGIGEPPGMPHNSSSQQCLGWL